MAELETSGDGGASDPDAPRTRREVTGLSSAEAAERLAAQGPNRLPTAPPPPWWRSLLAQMTHFFAVMLWIAGVLAFVAGLPQLGVAIYVVIVVNGVFAFLQEHRAERAAERLRDLLPRDVTVVRDGEPVTVPADDLVVDDVVLLEAGDRISADLVASEAHALRVDTSTLTGESVPEAIEAGDHLSAGCFVVEGEARAVVVAVGADTRLAGIAALARSRSRPPSPLARELHRLVITIARIAVGVGVAFFGLALLLGTAPSDGFLFAVGVTVALVPEGLLPTVTLSLAIGAQRMAARKALVRRLESVETLGSTTFICTDKTGTLTRNEMEVRVVWTPTGTTRLAGGGYGPVADLVDGSVARAGAQQVAQVARACSTGRAVEVDGVWRAQGDPMEAAIDALSRRLADGIEPVDGVVRRRFPFDPRRRRMSVVVDGRLLLKGAPETVLDRCRPPGPGVDDPAEVVEQLTAEGLRVLAVATRDARAIGPDDDADRAERDLTLLGLLAFEDPPRSDVHDSLGECRRAGIKVAMITGDHPATAHAIAVETGLALPGAPVLDGSDLPDDDTELGELLDTDGIVVARVSPEDKLRIARALQERGHVVAMTGDGVNDGPALQQADIGVAMGESGTDVARESADLVLLDDHFATIVAAVEQGRATFTNVRRFLTYHLTDNVAELTPFVVWALSAGRIPLALGVLQILALDIGTDLLPALALGAEPPSDRVLDRAPHSGHLLNRRVLVRVFGVLGPAEAVIEMAAFAAVLLVGGWRPGHEVPTDWPVLLAASGAAFSAVVLGQLANMAACRSSFVPVWRLRWRGANRLLGIAAVTSLAALAASLFVPWLADLLGQAPPPPVGWAVALLAVPAVWLADSVHKRARRGRAARLVAT